MSERGITGVTTAEQQAYNDVIVIDCRYPYEYASGTISRNLHGIDDNAFNDVNQASDDETPA